MSQRGRPRNSQTSVHIAIAGWLHPEYDADILAWLNAIPKGQRLNALKAALRNVGLALQPSPTNGQADESQSAADAILSNWEF